MGRARRQESLHITHMVCGAQAMLDIFWGGDTQRTGQLWVVDNTWVRRMGNQCGPVMTGRPSGRAVWQKGSQPLLFTKPTKNPELLLCDKVPGSCGNCCVAYPIEGQPPPTLPWRWDEFSAFLTFKEQVCEDPEGPRVYLEVCYTPRRKTGGAQRHLYVGGEKGLAQKK